MSAWVIVLLMGNVWFSSVTTYHDREDCEMARATMGENSAECVEEKQL